MKYAFRTTSVCFLLLSFCPGTFAQDTFGTAARQGRIDVTFNGATRLSGGFPVIEGQTFDSTLTRVGNSFRFGNDTRSARVAFKRSTYANVFGIYLTADGFDGQSGDKFTGLFFSGIPAYRQGVAFYRYKPWNAWTKPVKIHALSAMEAWDNQCFYWQYEDGIYGIAVPLTGYGYRATLGSEGGAFGSKAEAYVDGHQMDSIPAMVIGFGANMYTLMTAVYKSAMEFMGTPENLVQHKTFPEPLQYLGWCTWNASAQGTRLNEETIKNGVATFTTNKFPLGWVLIDDGWFNHDGSQLRSLAPDVTKFPNGFSRLIRTLKSSYHLRHVGVWHAFNGYWNGIDPDSPLGEQYKSALFSWEQPQRPDVENAAKVTYHFIRPDSDSLGTFYRNFHRYLKNEGFDFIKVDNQLVVERMSVDNYPIETMAKAMHAALNASAAEYFDNAVINCMDMTADAYYNFGTAAVGRSVEDYFPFEKGENYNLQRGNAAAHVLQGVYNNMYFSQMVFPDLDMFQTHNPNAEFHAIARAINNGPIYVTDNPGEQNFKILNKLVLRDGKILRADTPLLPTADCLFQVQDKQPFKAFSMSNGIGLLGIWNCADTDEVRGTFSAADINGLSGEKFVVYETAGGKYHLVDGNTKLPVVLKRLQYALYYIVPVQHGVAPLGILDKYNAPATLRDIEITKHQVKITTRDGGKLGVVLPSKPTQISVNNKPQKKFTFSNGLLLLDLDSNGKAVQVTVDF